jgi:hypothetical protein
MTHSINNFVREIDNLTAFNIPQDQIVYGTKIRQDIISSDIVNYKDNPSLYLTKSLNEVINTALSQSYNNTIMSKINIIHGLDMTLGDTYITNDYVLVAIIHPGVLIIDDVLVEITNPIEFHFNIPPLAIINKTYDHVVISAEYTYLKENPIKFTVWLYNYTTHIIFNDIGQVWDSKQFIYKTISLKINSNSDISLVRCKHTEIIINGKSYTTRFHNYYKWMYLQILLEMFGNYTEYVIDIPFIPPIPKASVYGITELFV